MHRIYCIDGVLQYFPNPNPPPLEKIERFVQHIQTHWEQHGYGNCGIVPPGETEIIIERASFQANHLKNP